MSRQALLLSIIVLLVMPLVVAQIYKQGTEIDLKIPCINSSGALCSATTSCNITALYPNNTIIINGGNMTRTGTYFNYTLVSEQTQETGEYTVFAICQNDYRYSAFTFDITYNGKEKPTEWIVILFMVFFIALVAGFIITLFLIIRDFAAHNIDILDVVKYFGLYIALVTVHYFSQDYLGNNLVDNVLSMFVKFGIVTHGIVLFTGFAYSLIINKLKEAQRIRMGE